MPKRELEAIGSLGMRIVRCAQAASPDVRLAGGTGLALLLRHRVSEDLDLFCRDIEDVDLIVRAVDDAVRGEGGVAHRVRTSPGFVRLQIETGSELCRVDVAVGGQPRLEPEGVVVDDIRVESLRDQRANKIAALLGRSELRDLVDLYFIEQAGLSVVDGFVDALRTFREQLVAAALDAAGADE